MNRTGVAYIDEKKKMLREMKRQRTQKLRCISIELHRTCLSLQVLFPSPPPLLPPLPHPPSQPTQCEEEENEDLYDDPFHPNEQ